MGANGDNNYVGTATDYNDKLIGGSGADSLSGEEETTFSMVVPVQISWMAAAVLTAC
jgi:hypothetical protein